MNRKEFLLHIWKWFFLPALLIAAGYFVAVLLAGFVTDFSALTFIAGFFTVGAIALAILYMAATSIKVFLQKIINRLPESIRYKARFYKRVFNGILEYLLPVFMGAMFYYAWINGKHEFVIGYAAVLLVKKIREIVQSERNKKHAQAHTTPQT